MVHQIVSTGKDKGEIPFRLIFKPNIYLATTWVKAYANLDNLRPHFDVEPRTVVNRLIQSFVPITDLSSPEKGTHCSFQLFFFLHFSVPTELYGPLVTSLTLVAVLQMNMKTSNTSLEEATLIETALTTCFGYWAFLTGVIIGLSYLCSTYINKIQVVLFLDFNLLKSYSGLQHCWIRNGQSRCRFVSSRAFPHRQDSLLHVLVHNLRRFKCPNGHCDCFKNCWCLATNSRIQHHYFYSHDIFGTVVSFCKPNHIRF